MQNVPQLSNLTWWQIFLFFFSFRSWISYAWTLKKPYTRTGKNWYASSKLENQRVPFRGKLKYAVLGWITIHVITFSSLTIKIVHHTWGMEQNRKVAGSFKAAIYWRQSSACIKALVTMSFKHCTDFAKFCSHLKSYKYQWRGGLVFVNTNRTN